MDHLSGTVVNGRTYHLERDWAKLDKESHPSAHSVRRKRMRKFSAHLVLIAVCLCHAHSFAEQIVMSNGDRLSGLIVKSDGKELVIKTEFAGEVTVQCGMVKRSWGR
jgi:hypothetical protein